MDNFVRVYNTTVSGSALVSSLSGDDVRALQFASALAQTPPLVLTTPGPDSVYVDQWVQSSIASLGLNGSAGTGAISLGEDSATGARFYQELFNLKTVNDSRLLRFYLSATGPQVSLENTSSPGTHSYVSVLQDGISASNTHILFNSSVAAGAGACAGAGPGLERFVLVSASNVSTPSIEFNILTRSV